MGAMTCAGGRAAVVGALIALAAPLGCFAAVTACTTSASGVVFGTYTPLTPTALLANGTVAISCTGVTANNGITIDLSTGTSGNYASRTLVSGASTLDYNLYLDAAYTQVWGNGSGGSLEGSVAVTNGHPNPTLTVYGAVAAGQDPLPGTYSDSITVSVNY